MLPRRPVDWGYESVKARCSRLSFWRSWRLAVVGEGFSLPFSCHTNRNVQRRHYDTITYVWVHAWLCVDASIHISRRPWRRERPERARRDFASVFSRKHVNMAMYMTSGITEDRRNMHENQWQSDTAGTCFAFRFPAEYASVFLFLSSHSLRRFFLLHHKTRMAQLSSRVQPRELSYTLNSSAAFSALLLSFSPSSPPPMDRPPTRNKSLSLPLPPHLFQQTCLQIKWKWSTCKLDYTTDIKTRHTRTTRKINMGITINAL